MATVSVKGLFGLYYNQQPCMAKILHVHVCLPSPFNTCIVNTESLHCIHFQSNE